MVARVLLHGCQVVAVVSHVVAKVSQTVVRLLLDSCSGNRGGC